ncbi:acyltransferase [Salmonella enterica]|nr:acyltransferase [Salmonella enterica]EFA3283535.1 acyltransferase [Salmonella enterica]EIY5380617.1 acyltransferase [Salmonella enterica]ELS7530230.1 acyltransferase [Salmonella enterica]
MKGLESNYISRLDHLRFLAASLVVFVHVYSAAGGHNGHSSSNVFLKFFLSGNTGVTLFLVISGFIFTVITKAGKETINYKSFIFNRIKRIAPLLVVALVISISLNRATVTFNDVMSMFFLSNMAESPLIKTFGPTWTIAIETQFYLVVPFLLLFLNKNGIKYILSLSLFWVLIRTLLILTYQQSLGAKPEFGHYSYLTMIGRFDQLLIGMIAGYTYLKHKNLFTSKILLAVSSIIVFFAITRIYKLDAWNKMAFSSSLLTYAEAVAWALFIISYTCADIRIPNWLDNTLSKLGEVSYSQYILHVLLIGFISSYTGWLDLVTDPKLNAVFNFLLFLPVVMIFSKISFELIEKPFLQMRRKYI